MRVTQNMTYNTYIKDIMRRQESLNDLNIQIATGKKVNVPSDDPVNAERILSEKSALSVLGQYRRNIDSGMAYLDQAEQSLTGVKNVLTSIKEIAVSNATGTMDAASRANAAVVVSSLYDELVSLANAEHEGKYIFSGYKTDTAAFTSAGAYQGDTNKYDVRISGSSSITLGINGGDVFKGASGGVDIFQSVTDLITALNADDTAGIEAAIADIDSSFSQVSDAVADIGGKANRLMSAGDNLSEAKLNMEMIISGLEDTDIAEVISELKLGQIALEAALTSAGKVFTVNIFNYL